MMAVTTPYVTAFGGGVMAMPNENFAVSAMVIDKAESSRSVGLDDLGSEGWNLVVGGLGQ
jgi:hypothetical protein